MALSGVHITCGYAGSARRDTSASIMGDIAWAQTMASPGTTTQVAPSPRDAEGAPLFQVYSSADVYVAVDTAPDASTTTSKRIFVPAITRVEIYAEANDKLAWVLA